jgi:HEAT repeat protein
MNTDHTALEPAVLTLLSRIEIDEGVEEAVRAMGEPAERALVRAARGEIADVDVYQRANAVYLLGALGTKDAPDELVKVLEGATIPRLRLTALHGLTRLGGDASRKALVRLMRAQKADRGEQIVALRGLAEIGKGDDLETLAQLPLDPAFPPLEAARQDALAAIGRRKGQPAR